MQREPIVIVNHVEAGVSSAELLAYRLKVREQLRRFEATQREQGRRKVDRDAHLCKAAKSRRVELPHRARRRGLEDRDFFDRSMIALSLPDFSEVAP